MQHMSEDELKRVLKLFLCAVFCFGVVEGFSLNIFSNYFKDAFNVSDQVRGWIETPREFPGVLCMFYLPALAMFSDVKLARLGAVLCTVSMFVMGLLSPSFPVMMVFLFIFSFGSHTYYPMEASIGLAIAGQTGDIGKTLGRVKSATQVAYFFAASCVYIFFRNGFFDFTVPVKKPFVFAGIAGIATVLILSYISKYLSWMPRREKGKFVVRREYAPYYWLNFAYGIQKRIRMVFGLWVFTQLLNKKADFTAVLLIISAVIGIVVSPYMGRLLDVLGQKKAIAFEGVYMIIVFGIFGFIAKGFYSGNLALTGTLLAVSVVIFVAADMTKMFDFFHNVVMKRIAVVDSDVSPSLSVGQAIDHVMAITLSPLFGSMWANFGPQSVFWTCAAFSLVQLVVAAKLPEKEA